ncbi:MAG: hypothetical protein GX251_11930 [Firmicutes bacterium]|nr:hypothetical protein [Enterococcus cecorum]NLL44037.1 hypothetical protein [Bacillota bacterium]
MKRITSSDIFDINKKTGALILGKNRLDDYATKFLTKYCKQALVEPMPLPVEDILKSMGLKVQEAYLSSNLDVFGCCLLLSSNVDIYNHDTKELTPTRFEAGTILIDPLSEAFYGEGSKRNTLIHEAVHWEKDKRYFEILEIKNKSASEKLYPILCRQSETYFIPPEGKNTKENEVKWLEWQAHRLAPRILMPKNTFKRKALEYIERRKANTNNTDLTCDSLIEELSEFFIVSRSSVKYRLLEVGLEGDISEFEDYEVVYEDTNTKKEFVKLSPTEAIKLLLEDTSLQNWVKDGRFVFAEGYFVLAEKQYVVKKEGQLNLTAKAKRNLSKCAINIREQRFVSYPHMSKDLIGFTVLKKVEGVDTRLLTFHPKYQNSFEYEPNEVYDSFRDYLASHDEEEEIELMTMIGNPTTTLCECLWFLMKNRNWQYPEKFNNETELHKNYHGKIKNNDYNNMSKKTLLAICIGLRLNLRITEELFKKSQEKLNYYKDPDRIYVRIMETMPSLTIANFNSILRSYGIEELGTKISE